MKGVYNLIYLSDLICFLRYGWFSTEPKTAAEPSTSAIDKVDLQSEGAQRYSRAATENSYDKVGKHTGLPRKDFRSINASETINADTEKISTGAVHLKVKCCLFLCLFGRSFFTCTHTHTHFWSF